MIRKSPPVGTRLFCLRKNEQSYSMAKRPIQGSDGECAGFQGSLLDSMQDQVCR